MTRIFFVLCCCLLGTLATSTARADDTRSGRVVPTVHVSGSTNGKGQATAGVDLRVDTTNPNWEMRVAPSFTVANSSGVASIFSVSTDGAQGPTQFSGGLSLTFAYTDRRAAAQQPDEATPYRQAMEACLTFLRAPGAAKDESNFFQKLAGEAFYKLLTDVSSKSQMAHNVLITKLNTKMTQRYKGACKYQAINDSHASACNCGGDRALEKKCGTWFGHQDGGTAVLTELVNACPQSGADQGEEAVCDWLTRPDIASGFQLASDDYCVQGKVVFVAEKMKARDDAYVRKFLYPRHLISLGGIWGAGSFKYLPDTGGPTNMVTPTTSTDSTIVLGLLYTYVRSASSDRFTFELPVIYQSIWTQSANAANLCTPSTLSGKQSVQPCTQIPLGGPTHGEQLSLSALFGIAQIAESDLWRIAAGPTLMHDFSSDAKTAWQVGAEVPLYLSLTKAAGYGGDYEGMVRIMPVVLGAQTNGQWGATAGLTVALLGKRTMFGSQLYWP